MESTRYCPSGDIRVLRELRLCVCTAKVPRRGNTKPPKGRPKEFRCLGRGVGWEREGGGKRWNSGRALVPRTVAFLSGIYFLS